MNDIDQNIKAEISTFQVRQFQEVVNRLFQCCQERMQYQSEKFGLPDAELRCLMLFDQEHYLTAKVIAHRMNVVKSRVTSIVNGLMTKGHIQRIPDPEDSRVSLLSPTPLGRKTIATVRAFQDTMHREVLRQMAPEQRNAMLANMNLLKASMEAIKELMV